MQLQFLHSAVTSRAISHCGCLHLCFCRSEVTALALWMLLESDLWETDIFWVITPGAGRVHQGLVVVQQNPKAL